MFDIVLKIKKLNFLINVICYYTYITYTRGGVHFFTEIKIGLYLKACVECNILFMEYNCFIKFL